MHLKWRIAAASIAGQPQRTFTLLKRWVTHVLFTWRSIAWIVSFPPDSHRETEIKNQKAKFSAPQACNPLRLLSIMRSMQISELTPGMGRASSLLKARNTQVSPLSATIKLMSRISRDLSLDENGSASWLGATAPHI